MSSSSSLSTGVCCRVLLFVHVRMKANRISIHRRGLSSFLLRFFLPRALPALWLNALQVGDRVVAVVREGTFHGAATFVGETGFAPGTWSDKRAHAFALPLQGVPFRAPHLWLSGCGGGQQASHRVPMRSMCLLFIFILLSFFLLL